MNTNGNKVFYLVTNVQNDDSNKWTTLNGFDFDGLDWSRFGQFSWKPSKLSEGESKQKNAVFWGGGSVEEYILTMSSANVDESSDSDCLCMIWPTSDLVLQESTEALKPRK